MNQPNPIQRIENPHLAAFEALASYADVQRKGAEIYRAGGVDPIAVGATFVEAKVRSVSGRTYTTLLSFSSGDSAKIDDWACDCPWSKWNYKRAPKYKYLEHRKCSHALALYYFVSAFKYKLAPTKKKRK